MFEVRCIVKDKDLAQALRALKPIALEPPVVIPADGELDKNEAAAKVVAVPRRSAKKTKKVGHSNGGRKMGSGNATKTIDDYLVMLTLQAKPGEKVIVTTKQMKHHLMGYGYSHGGYYPVQQALIGKGVLTRTDDQATYEVKIDGKT